MNEFVFAPPPPAAAPVEGGGMFPVRRIFCIGRNYADHVREMGGDPKETPPVFFTKPADAAVDSGAAIPYPLATDNLHFEGELVVALKRGGVNISADAAADCIFGYATGCDLTRRDHQAAAKQEGAPWDTAKGFDRSAPIGAIKRLKDVSPEHLNDARVVTRVNGETRQDAALNDMIWSVPEIIAALSQQFELKAGDLIFTGTPEGVGPLSAGDQVEVEIDELPKLSFSIVEPE